MKCHVIEVEQISGLQDLEAELEEVDINNVSLFEDQIDEETNEWEEDNEEGESEDEYGDDFTSLALNRLRKLVM